MYTKFFLVLGCNKKGEILVKIFPIGHFQRWQGLLRQLFQNKRGSEGDSRVALSFIRCDRETAASESQASEESQGQMLLFFCIISRH